VTLLVLLAGIVVLVEKYGEPNTHYEALGLAPTATRAEIRKRYKELALRWHPDKVEGRHRGASWICRAWQKLTGYDRHASRRFLRISEANQVLSDERARAAYDTHLRKHTLRVDDVPRASWSFARAVWWQLRLLSPFQTFVVLTSAVAALEYIALPLVCGLFYRQRMSRRVFF
ncbi:hypothetical protein CTAYLR_005283, partial [Chrysophaeum taylorii]